MFSFFFNRKKAPQKAITIDIQQIINLLEKAIANKTISDEELQSVTWIADGELDKHVWRAWHSLSHWVSDEDIRERDVEYADRKRARLIAYISEIDELTKNN